MVLLPLEFTDCLQDSPYFRDSLHCHEKELERTSNHIKELIKETKNVLHAAKALSAAQRKLSQTLIHFKFDCIGYHHTDDEIWIAGSLNEFGKLISAIEDERDKMLGKAYDQFVVPLENFRKEQIGAVKERKKRFEKETAKFCASQERYLGLSTKKQDTVLQEADAMLEMEHREFVRAGLEYVCLIQEVQERKKFEFVETLLGFMYSWLTFYHSGHEIAKDFKPHMTELQTRIQRTRENFNSSREDIHSLMQKMLEVRQAKPIDPGTLNRMYTRTGYLFLMEKKALGTTWTKCYCHYDRDAKLFKMIPYNQTAGKIVSTETFRLRTCVKRISDSIDKRFCFDVVPEDKTGVVYTFQALSSEDRDSWLDAMDGKEAMWVHPPRSSDANQTFLDETGFHFVVRCIQVLESRGLDDQGLYRVVGVASKVTKLLNYGLDKKKSEKLCLEDPFEWEAKTITSAVKTFFRNLPEPIMTFKHHAEFISAAKLETYEERVNRVQSLVQQLPEPNQGMLQILMAHLEKVALNCKVNMMTVSNLAVCFGPTLLRSEEETVAAIMDIKFANVIVEILIENWRQILRGEAAQLRPNVSATGSGLSASRQGSASRLTVLPVSYSLSQLHNGQAPCSQYQASSPRSSGSSSTLQISPKRPPPPYPHPPPPPALTTASSVILANQTSPPGSQSSGSVAFHSATWERHLKGAASTCSLMVVPPPLGSAPPPCCSSPRSPLNGSVKPLSVAGVSASHRPPRSRVYTSMSNLDQNPPAFYEPSVGWYKQDKCSSRTHLPHVPLQRQLSSGQSSLHLGYSSSRKSSTELSAEEATSGQPYSNLYTSAASASSSSSSSVESLTSSSSRDSFGHGDTLLERAAREAALSAAAAVASSSAAVKAATVTAAASTHTPSRVIAYLDDKDMFPHTPNGAVAALTSDALGPVLDTPCRLGASGQVQPDPSACIMTTSPSTASSSSSATQPPVKPRASYPSKSSRRVKTLYACLAEHDNELSFEPNQIITSIRPSVEPGWLEGCLNGKFGLVPENYVEYIK